MGPTALTIAAPCGFVVKAAKGSTLPVPSGAPANASTYGRLGFEPGYGCLQHLRQALVEQRHAGRSGFSRLLHGVRRA